MMFRGGVVEYNIDSCSPKSHWVSFDRPAPENVEKTWAFFKSNTTMTITCNGVEVLSLHFNVSSKCSNALGGDVVDGIAFTKGDDASVSYATHYQGSAM